MGIRESLTNRLRVWGPAAAWAAVLFLLSAWPNPGLDAPSWLPLPDKFAHVGLYAVLGAALGHGWAWSPTGVGHALLLVIGAVYGVTDEWHQLYVPGRFPDVADWFADVTGLLIGYGSVVTLMGRKADPGVDSKGMT